MLYAAKSSFPKLI